MKLKYNVKYLFIGMLVISFSCTKTLELSPVSTITNASFWKTEDDAKGALSGMYVKLRDQSNINLFIWGETRSEVMRWGENGTVGYDVYYYNTLNPDNAGPSWQGLYGIVNASNLILKYAPNISFNSESSKNTVLAQAYTMRAFVYYVMARTWGDVPLRTEPIESADPSVTQAPKAPVAQVFQLIKEDLDQAINLFPSNDFSNGKNRWSKASANALKADVYLWTGKLLGGGQGDFQMALQACEEVQKADLALLPNFADLFRFDNKNNQEVLMSVGYKPNESSNNYFFNMYSTTNPNAIDPVTGQPIGTSSGGVVWTVTPLVTGQFSMDDSRRSASFDTTYTPTIILKGKGTVINGVRYFASDVVLYRYADVLLMKAEAENALGLDPSAEINLVRQRAYKDDYSSHVFVAGSKEYNDAAILKERLLELVFEGKRWWDLRRFGKVFDLVPTLQSRAGQEYLLLWPISKSVLSLEPSISQNSGW